MLKQGRNFLRYKLDGSKKREQTIATALKLYLSLAFLWRFPLYVCMRLNSSMIAFVRHTTSPPPHAPKCEWHLINIQITFESIYCHQTIYTFKTTIHTLKVYKFCVCVCVCACAGRLACLFVDSNTTF